MACLFSLLFVGFLALATREGMCSDMPMEEEELFGLFEVMGSLLEDPTWGQMHPLPCTETPWPGVECEIGQSPSTFHVTKIHIGPDVITPSCKPTAKISSHLLKLPFLKTLSLINCFTNSKVSLSASLFGALYSLEHLSLVSNPTLSGEIPPSLFKLSSLKILSLSQNNLYGDIPIQIGGLQNLQQLDLSFNNFTGSIPEQIGALKSLDILDLSWNSLQGGIPDSAGELLCLQKIDLSGNKLQGRPSSELGKLQRLELLDLSHNSFTGPIPENFSGLEKLEYLIMEENPINTELPSFLGALMNLKVLSFSNCGLTGSIPTSLAHLRNLTALTLENNSLVGTVPPEFGTLPNMDMLNLSKNQLSGEISFPQEFINRLGERLDVRENNGLCINPLFEINKNTSSSLLHNPSCLGTEFPNGNKTLAEEHPENNPERMKPSHCQDNISSSPHGLEQKFVFLTVFYLPGFAVSFLLH